jgi:hypothetical protein
MRSVLCAAVLVTFAAAEAAALDQPITARKLTLRRTAGGQEKLSFLTKDPAFLFPAIGSADDPAIGTPGGVLVEIFSEHRGAVAITVPGAVGWFTRDGAPPSYKFVNKQAPNGVSTVSSLLIKGGRALRLRGTSVGFGATGALGTVGVRITMGSLRSCALFDEVSIKREGRVFLARNATSGGLADCSNASLGGFSCTDAGDAPTCGGTCPEGSECATPDLSTCECISGAQPCGDTDPVCNGACPAGEVCGSVGGLPLPGCACLPAASTPCGDTAELSCGGDCPAGESCFGVSFPVGPITLDGCQCLSEPPVDACGGCPLGLDCIVGPGIGPLCLAFCSGGDGAPTCNGTCPGSFTCANLSGLCICQ